MKSLELSGLIEQLAEGETPLMLTHKGEMSLVILTAADYRAMQARMTALETELRALKVSQAEVSLGGGTETLLVDAVEVRAATLAAPKPRRMVAEAARFMSQCPDEVHDFIEEVMDSVEKAGMVAKWGRRGPSFRAVRPDESQCTLLYLFPPGAQQRARPFCEVYLGNIQNDEVRDQARARFVELGDFEPRGAYTLLMELSPDTLSVAREALVILWPLAQKIAAGDGC